MKLSRRPEDLERILEQLPIGFSYLDRDRRVLRVNAKLLDWMGMTGEHAVGKHCYALVAEMRGEDPATAAPCSFCRVPQAVADNQVQTFLNEVRPDLIMQNTTVPIQGEDGEIIGTVELLEDITARRQAEKLLLESHEELERRVAERTAELEELNRLKDLFVDILRHDLTNPLQVVSICHRHLREEGEVAASAQRYLDGLDEATRRAMKVVHDASTYGRLETLDRLPLEEVDLRGVIERAARSTAPVAEMGAPRVRIGGAGRCPIPGEPALLELVFTNLISNALSYGGAGTPVHVEVTDDDDAWRTQVTDWGPGIPAAHKISIFERFVRGERGGVRGTGLGLAIARRVIDLHQGQIWVEDNPEGGSVFVTRLPKLSETKGV